MNRTPLTFATRTQMPVVVLVLAGALPLLTGCAVIGDIFKAGVGVGVFLVVGLLAVVGGIVFMATKK